MPLDSQLIAGALAHGLSPGAIATWDPRLARTPRVMVPVQLDVLMVREEGGTWAQTAMAVPDPGSEPSAPTLLPDPFSERAPRPTGAYLHWALPDALTGGSGTAHGGDVSFPPIPDRWLIVRLSTPQPGARRAVTAWVLESGGQQPVVTPLDSWTEPEDPERTTTPGEQPLTALGHGDAAWSAYFDNVEDRLAFYDDLSDGQGGTVAGPLAYLVCGWHSRHIDDPIGEGLSTPAAFEARLAELGWEINPADIENAFSYADTRVTAATTAGLATREATFSRVPTAASGFTVVPGGNRDEGHTALLSDGTALLGRFGARIVSWPEFTLYHGGVVGIGWPDPGIGVAPGGLAGGDAGGPPPADSVTVTIGNTLTEALAARLAHNEGAPDEARALEAALLGGIDDLDQPDAPARIDALLHASGFAGLPGGTRSEDLTQSAVVPPTSVVADPAQTDPGVFAGQAGSPGSAGSAGSGGPAGAGGPPGTTQIPVSGTAGALAGRVRTDALTRISPAMRLGTMDTLVKGIKDALVVPVAVPPAPNAAAAEQTVSSDRALPRYFVPADPVFLLENAGRSFKHGSDGMHAESGNLVCRLSGHTVTGLSPSLLATGPGGSISGADLLVRGIDHGGVPPECEDLLAELALTDPGSAETAARTRSASIASIAAVTGAAPGQAPSVAAAAAISEQDAAQVYAVEQAAWWITRDDRRDSAALIARSGFTGTLPPPIAISLPAQPWVPLHLDWEAGLFALPALGDWDLGEIDFDAVADALPAQDAASGRTLSGRALLSGGAAQLAAATVRQVLEQAQRTAGSVALQPGITFAYHSAVAEQMVAQITSMRSAYATPQAPAAAAGGAADGPAAAASPADLDHIADELEKMDVLVGAMDRFTTKLRAGFVADGSDAAGDRNVPADFWAFRAGFLKITRLRLVDCFGQTLDVLGPGGAPPGGPVPANQILRSEPLTVTSRDDLVELAPRFTAPSRLWFRFLSADDDTIEATDAVSPVCGFVLPNHLDGDLQFHAADGSALGAVRFDTAAGVVWEESPGQPATLGSVPSSIIRNPHLAGLAQGLIDWGAADSSPDTPARDTALSSLLRIIDTSLWSVDPFGHVGDEHLALLVGHPIVVLRGLVRVEVAEPVAPGLVTGLRVPVRLGALAQWQDGLLGYLVGDDARTLHVPDPAVADFARPVGPHQGFTGQASTTSDYYNQFAADLGVIADPGSTPVDHPYVDTTGLLYVQPGQDVRVTMLAEPHSVIHATTGYLPRKQIGMRRGWVAAGLAALAPLFRFGPVLVDPKLIRMPVATDIRGTWSWSHRSDVSTWADEPVTNSLGDARMPPDPSQGQEGWLRLTPEEPLP
jgi:hypothetical protein